MLDPASNITPAIILTVENGGENPSKPDPLLPGWELEAITTIAGHWYCEMEPGVHVSHCEPQWPGAGGIVFSFVDLGTGYAGKVP